MSGNFITFEYPLNERFRTFLRVEQLFNQIDNCLNIDSTWDSKACLQALLDIITIIGQSDLKTEIIKELTHHINSLSRLAQTPSINRQALQTVLEELINNLETLQELPNHALQMHRENEFFARVKQRSTAPGGSLAFDIPELHMWLNLAFSERQTKLKAWLKPFNPLKQALSLILHLTRESTLPSKETAFSGIYQKNLPVQSTCQLIRIEFKNDLNVYPEVSGNKHRVSIRFMQEDLNTLRSRPTTHDIHFELTCCAI